MTRSARQHSFTGPYGTGPRMVRITVTEPSGHGALHRVVSQMDFPAADKAEALAIAKRERATFVA